MSTHADEQKSITEVIVVSSDDSPCKISLDADDKATTSQSKETLSKGEPKPKTKCYIDVDDSIEELPSDNIGMPHQK